MTAGDGTVVEQDRRDMQLPGQPPGDEEIDPPERPESAPRAPGEPLQKAPPLPSTVGTDLEAMLQALHSVVEERFEQQALRLEAIARAMRSKPTLPTAVPSAEDRLKEMSPPQVAWKPQTAAIQEWGSDRAGHAQHEDAAERTSHTGVVNASTTVTRQLQAAMNRATQYASNDRFGMSTLRATSAGTRHFRTGFAHSTIYVRLRIEAMLKSSKFDSVMGVLILLNALLIGIEADHLARHPDGDELVFVQVLEVAFTVVFAAELCVRMAIFGRSFWIGPEWKFNWFDALIVSTSIFEVMMDVLGQTSSGAENMTFLRILRNLKLVRVFRVIRVVRFFRELRMMMLSIASCFRSLFWTMFLLLMMMYMYSVGIMMLVYSENSGSERFNELFGTLPQGLLTMFQAITNGMDWGEISDELGELSGIASFVFLGYIVLATFAVMNIVTGFFVEQAMKAAETDLENTINEEIGERRRVMGNLQILLHKADKGQSGKITWVELQKQLQHPSVQAYFKSLNLEIYELRSLFELVSLGSDQAISIDKFVKCCLRLKGPARSSDLMLLRHEMEALVQQVLRSFDRVSAPLLGTLQAEDNSKLRQSGMNAADSMLSSDCAPRVSVDSVDARARALAQIANDSLLGDDPDGSCS